MGLLKTIGCQIYAGKWQLVGTEKFGEEDFAEIKSAKVVDSKNAECGKSICFFLVGGGYNYVPMSINGTQLNAGEEVDLHRISIETLHRDGNADIYRARVD